MTVAEVGRSRAAQTSWIVLDKKNDTPKERNLPTSLSRLTESDEDNAHRHELSNKDWSKAQRHQTMGMEGPKATAVSETISPNSRGNAIATGGTASLLLFAAAANTIGSRSSLGRDGNDHCIDGRRYERHD